MATGLLCSRPVTAALTAMALFMVLVVVFTSQTQYETPNIIHQTITSKSKLAINTVFRPSIKPDTEVYSPYGTDEWKLPEVLQQTKPLGKSLCILDLDSRPLDGEGQVFGPLPLSFDVAKKISGPSLGTLQHWLYAKIHGYQYHFIETGKYEDRRDSWKKPSIIGRALQKYPVVVFMDSDAIVNHLDLPFEWLMNYWGINKTDALSMAVDPAATANRDEKGRVYANTGFIVGQQTPVTADLMRDWNDCPNDNSKYTNCTDYRDKWYQHPSDQGGFGNYVRYDYDSNIKELSCKEANGYPEHVSSCKGTFIKHLWDKKNDLLKVAVLEQMPGVLLELLHQQMLAEKKQFYLTEAQLMSNDWLKS